jgi:hypothetical protein
MHTTRSGARCWAAALAVFLLSACSTLPPEIPPPAAGDRYAGPLSKSDIPLVRAPDIPALVPHWKSLSAGGGLSVLAGIIEKPRLEFWALKVELDCNPRIFLGAGGKLRPGYVLSTRVSSFVRDQGLAAGINTVPFDPSSAREGEERRLAGLAIGGGELIAPPVPRYDALVFYAEGGAAIVNQGEIDQTAGKILHATGGFHRILQDGELTDRARQKAAGPRHARSAAGLSAGGRTLYLMVINGGLPGRPGATEAETARILKQLGARDVLNLDGGGSSALALRFSDSGSNTDDSAGGRVRLLNTPVHGFPGRERAVGLCLGLAFSP